MAVNANRIRRALSLSTSFMNLHKHRLPSISSTHSLLQNLLSSPSQIYPRRRFVHSTNIVHYSSRSFNVDKIDPDTILFEGCDYKHWLIVMDFGKDPDQRPPPEQMVETYVQTLAKVVGRYSHLDFHFCFNRVLGFVCLSFITGETVTL